MKTPVLLVIIAGIIAAGVFAFFNTSENQTKALDSSATVASPNPTPIPSPTPTPTPTPLSFADMQKLYGPCISLPVMFWHHIEDEAIAAAAKQTSLNVSPETFRGQMQYLKDRGYTPLSMTDLIAFFDQGAAVPKKSVLLTFDDGYADFYSNAFPVLKEFGFPATLFVSTGLMENPGYLTWNHISEMKSSGNVLFANHTWSHHNMQASRDVVTSEITTAKKQLADHGLDTPHTFAYPYGLTSPTAVNVLQAEGYSLGFSTAPGRILCKQQRLTLPRVRIGNSVLSVFGF